MQRKPARSTRLLVMPTPEISQQDLAYLQSLRNQRDLLNQELLDNGLALFHRLERGEHVEPGVHRAGIEETRKGTTITRRLVLNGLPIE